MTIRTVIYHHAQNHLVCLTHTISANTSKDPYRLIRILTNQSLTGLESKTV